MPQSYIYKQKSHHKRTSVQKGYPARQLLLAAVCVCICVCFKLTMLAAEQH